MWRSQPIIASTKITYIQFNIDLQADISFYCIHSAIH